MPKLSPEQLQAARVASGRLGGRPRRPTIEEAREKALDALVPASLRALAAHLGSEAEPNPLAWRAALRLLEMRFGPVPTEPEGVTLPLVAEDVEGMSWRQLQLLAARLVTAELPVVSGNGSALETP